VVRPRTYDLRDAAIEFVYIEYRLERGLDAVADKPAPDVLMLVLVFVDTSGVGVGMTVLGTIVMSVLVLVLDVFVVVVVVRMAVWMIVFRPIGVRMRVGVIARTHRAMNSRSRRIIPRPRRMVRPLPSRVEPLTGILTLWNDSSQPRKKKRPRSSSNALRTRIPTCSRCSKPMMP